MDKIRIFRRFKSKTGLPEAYCSCAQTVHRPMHCPDVFRRRFRTGWSLRNGFFRLASAQAANSLRHNRKKKSAPKSALAVRDSELQDSEGLSAGVLCDVAQFFLDSEELVVLCKSVGAAH